MRALSATVGLVTLGAFLAVGIAPLAAGHCLPGESCPMMGAPTKACHKGTALAARMDCCEMPATPAPAPPSASLAKPQSNAAATPLAVDVVAVVQPLSPAAAAPARSAQLADLGLHTLFSVFRI